MKRMFILLITCLIATSFFALNPPTLSSPSDGAMTWTGVNFNWNSVSGADYYEIQVDTVASFNSAALITNVEMSMGSVSYNPDTDEFISNLFFGKTYFWRVRAFNSTDTSAWSIRIISTKDYVTLSSPSDYVTNRPTSNVILNWDSHFGVSYYEVELDTTNLFNSGFLQSVDLNYLGTSPSQGDTQYNTGPLSMDQNYFWRVRAINDVDTSDWTSRVFSTGSSISIPETPILLSPSNGTNNITNPVNFDWSDAMNATSYEMEYSLNGNFINGTSSYVSASQETIANLIMDTTYFWRVRSFSGGYYSNWSSIYSFNTGVSCSETSSTISVTECFEYVSPSGNYTWNSTGFYDDTIQNVMGCDSVISILLTITTNLSTVVNGNTIEAIQNGANYQWLDCNGTAISGEINQSFSPTQNGSYAVEITNNTCVDTTDCVDIISVGLNDASFEDFIVHSANGFLRFNLNTERPVNVMVLNLSGQEVMRFFQINESILDISNLSAGVYVVKVSQGFQQAVKKLIVE